MRLVNTTSLKIEEVSDTIPEYAILSHTWGQEEISYQEWVYAQDQAPLYWGWIQDPKSLKKLKSRQGYHKIIGACHQASKDGFSWIWADTICIDKTSSAELIEAINSMYKWYSASAICYAYLADVPSLSAEDCCTQNSTFSKSRWFTRGWTLQELLAPNNVEFYSKDWLYISNKSLLAEQVHIITRIPTDMLTSKARLHDYSIAQRMSWASKRTTTRIEDIAYCLLGIFDVNMPFLYGEGRKAFLRLQEEIIRRSYDQSFLVWRSVSDEGLAASRSASLLAPSPACFHEEEATVTEVGDHPFSFNNIGLSIKVALVETRLTDFVFAVLPCAILPENRPPPVWKDHSLLTSDNSVWIPLKRSTGVVYDRMVFPARYIQIARLYPVGASKWGSSTLSYPDVADIIIRSREGRQCDDLWWQLEVQLPRLQKIVSPSPRVGVLLTFPSTLRGWEVCSMSPDYRAISPPYVDNPDDGILWLESSDGKCGVDYCTIEFAHSSDKALTVRFVLASHLKSNGLWEPYARCASTGPKRTDLDLFSKLALEKLPNWSHVDSDEWARVLVSGPWSDFPKVKLDDVKKLSNPKIFVAQLIFKDPLEKEGAS